MSGGKLSVEYIFLMMGTLCYIATIQNDFFNKLFDIVISLSQNKLTSPYWYICWRVCLIALEILQFILIPTCKSATYFSNCKLTALHHRQCFITFIERVRDALGKVIRKGHWQKPLKRRIVGPIHLFLGVCTWILRFEKQEPGVIRLIDHPQSLLAFRLIPLITVFRQYSTRPEDNFSKCVWLAMINRLMIEFMERDRYGKARNPVINKIPIQ